MLNSQKYYPAPTNRMIALLALFAQFGSSFGKKKSIFKWMKLNKLPHLKSFILGCIMGLSDLLMGSKTPRHISALCEDQMVGGLSIGHTSMQQKLL